MLPSNQQTNQQPEGSKKRKRTNGGRDDIYVEAIKDACVSMGEKFGTATQDLAKTIKQLAHKSETKAHASALWGEIQKVKGLTREEIYASYFKILHDEMLLIGFQDIPAKEKAEWIHHILP